MSGGASIHWVRRYGSGASSRRQLQRRRPAREIPDPVRKQLQDLGKRLWAEVAEQSRRKVQAERDALQRERQEMQAAQAEIGATADRLARRIEELEARCAALKEEAGGPA